ncbi:hypothetical protein Dimus_027861 [Dionaea muscipula]
MIVAGIRSSGAIPVSISSVSGTDVAVDAAAVNLLNRGLNFGNLERLTARAAVECERKLRQRKRRELAAEAGLRMNGKIDVGDFGIERVCLLARPPRMEVAMSMEKVAIAVKASGVVGVEGLLRVLDYF